MAHQVAHARARGEGMTSLFQPVRSVVIVGAGSAGWLTALALGTYCPSLKIRLVHPRANNPIGVGESTQPDFPALLQAAGIDIEEFFRECDVTIKCGIFYRDWNAVGDHYWHPFTKLADTGPYTAAHHYQQLILANPSAYSHENYYAAVHTSYETCVKRNLVAPESALAFHVDAAKLAAYLRRRLKNVEIVESDRIDVQVADGKVSALTLDGDRSVAADLYVDCTGFARAVLGKITTPKKLPYEANVNRAVAASVPYADKRVESFPYTRAQAHDQGWTWSIPLQSRIGSGYVYHADFCTREQAERNFRQYWGEERMRDVEVKHISFDSDTLRDPWVGNVVCVGLSAGFVEPLEATGLNWMIGAAGLLGVSLGKQYFDEHTIERYNAMMVGYIHDVQDFVDTHYKLSSRRDSEFWRYQTSRAYPERLNRRLEVYAAEMPNSTNRPRNFSWAFNEVSWLDILNAYRFPYRRIAVAPEQVARAEEALHTIRTAPRQGADPLTAGQRARP
jgi:tryptophan halogenase